jgi:hypothetical protein
MQYPIEDKTKDQTGLKKKGPQHTIDWQSGIKWKSKLRGPTQYQVSVWENDGGIVESHVRTPLRTWNDWTHNLRTTLRRFFGVH